MKPQSKRTPSGTGVSPVLSAIHGNQTGETPVPLYSENAPSGTGVSPVSPVAAVDRRDACPTRLQARAARTKASRIHLEVATPRDIKTGGADLPITFGFADSPFGRCLIADSPRGICDVAFTNKLDELRADWPHAQLKRDDQAAAELARRIFVAPPSRGELPARPRYGNACQRASRRLAPTESEQTLRVFVRGTPFQVRVWRALLRVPAGRTTSYGQLAAAIGQPAASRAVGNAVGQNPIAFLIPCHRVIRSTGAIGGYHWGTACKRAILAWESANHFV